MTKQRFTQTKATYKVDSTANIPTTNVLVKSRRSVKHAILWKQGESSCIIHVRDHKYRSDDVRKTDEWCETISSNITMR